MNDYSARTSNLPTPPPPCAYEDRVGPKGLSTMMLYVFSEDYCARQSKVRKKNSAGIGLHEKCVCNTFWK